MYGFGYGFPFEMDYAPDHVRELEELDSKTLELGAVHASPHGEDALERCQKELMEAGFPPVDPVHKDFLRLCGGFWFRDIRIYGPAEVPAQGAMDGPLPSLVTANRLIREEGVNLGNRLLIGRSWRGCLFVYDPAQGKHLRIDGETLQEYASDGRFDPLLLSDVSAYVSYIRRSDDGSL